jgi:branched-chain amino acid transport system substrate-binding protein
LQKSTDPAVGLTMDPRFPTLPFMILRKSGSCLALALLVMPGCGPKPAPPDIKIGLIVEATGDIPAVGASCKNAAQMAVSEINAAGGFTLGGQRHGLSLVIEDSGGKADQAAAAARKLADAGVIAIIGPNASLGAVPAAKVADESKVLLITPWATAPNVTRTDDDKARPNVFRACFTDPFEGHVLAKFALDYMRAKKAAVLYDVASVAPRSQAELFRKEFEAAGGKIVAFESYKTGDKDFSAQFKVIQAASPDVIFLPSYYNDVPAQLKMAHQMGLKVPFLGSDNWSAPEMVKLAGADAEGAYYCGHYSPLAKNTVTGTFVVSYQKAHGKETPDDVAALTYDSVNLLKTAITAAGGTDRQAVRAAMAGIRSFEGVTGKISYPPGSGDPVKSAVMMQVQNGANVFITNIDP